MIKKIGLLLFFVLSLSACSTGVKGVAETPEVSVYGVKIANMNLSEANLALALRVKNPNAFSIPLRGFDYGLALNGVQVAQGSERKNLTISAKEDRIIEIPVKIGLMQLVQAVPDIVKSRNFTYDLKGKAHLPLLNLPFQRVGKVGNY